MQTISGLSLGTWEQEVTAGITRLLAEDNCLTHRSSPCTLQVVSRKSHNTLAQKEQLALIKLTKYSAIKHVTCINLMVQKTFSLSQSKPLRHEMATSCHHRLAEEMGVDVNRVKMTSKGLSTSKINSSLEKDSLLFNSYKDQSGQSRAELDTAKPLPNLGNLRTSTLGILTKC